MPKYIPYLILGFILITIVVLGVMNGIGSNVQTETHQDAVSCYCPKPSLPLIAKGVVTNIVYERDANGKKWIKFHIDGNSMELDYDKTKSENPYFYEVYGTDKKGNIEEGAYYYIYDWGMKTVWSKTPKTVTATGGLIDYK